MTSGNAWMRLIEVQLTSSCPSCTDDALTPKGFGPRVQASRLMRLESVPTLQGYLAHTKQSPSLRPPYNSRYGPTVRSKEGDVSFE